MPRASRNRFIVGWCLLALPLLCGAGAYAELLPQVVKTVYPTEDVVVASMVVDAPSDGVTDATPAIQAAIEEAAAGGGAVLFLPEGRYLLKGHLVLRAAVTLRGDWKKPSKGGSNTGTILMPTEHRGNPDGAPAIAIECGAGIREMTIWYPEQNPEAIVAYPWTFRTSSAAGPDNFTVYNVTLVNPYQAFKTGPDGNELHTVKNVYGTPLKTGVWIDTCTDIGRVVDIDFSPRWWEDSKLPGAPESAAAKKALRTHLRAEAVGVDMGRSDWEFLYGLRVEGYAVGMVIRKGERGTTNTAVFSSTFVDCATGLRLDKLNGVGLAATACHFEGAGVPIHCPDSFDTVAQFNTCVFKGTAPHSVLHEGTGTVTFQNCRFTGWTQSAVRVDRGAVSMLGCSFDGKGSHVELGRDTKRACLLGNTFKGLPQIKNAAKNGDIQIAHRKIPFAVPDVSRPPARPNPKPANTRLFSVTDFGADSGAEDNTAAFARALAEAKAAGGGTVYIPAGNYRFAGTFVVPSGVELRGISDVPHHTQSAGSVLMPVGGRGEEDGTPFIRLEKGSGLRGLTIWYPEQNLMAITPYPWAVRGLGPKCWLIDVTISNVYQAVDFWTHPSEGHVISYLAGAFLKRGLFVSKSGGEGWVEDVQFNPHYGLRLHKSMPRPKYPHVPFPEIIAQQRGKLEAMIFGRCEQEHVYRTFLYAAYDGIAFRDDEGGSNARVIMHGTDTGSRCAVLEACGDQGIEFLNPQLVPLGDFEVSALVVEDSFKGKAGLFNAQLWAGSSSGIIGGTGEVTIQQMNTKSGDMVLRGGKIGLENIVFQRGLRPHVTVEAGCAEARLVGNVSLAGEFRVVNKAGEKAYLRANSACQRPQFEGEGVLTTGWEEGDPQGLANTVAVHGGAVRSVSEGTCAVVEGQAHKGKRCLRLAGHADDAKQSYAYFKVFDKPLRIYHDSQIQYWMRPVNDRGRNVGIDLLFTDGSVLRGGGTSATDGQGMHPCAGRGTPGAWSQIVAALGAEHHGKTVSAIMFAYDKRGDAGAFEALIDDLSLTTSVTAAMGALAVTPKGGAVARGTAISIAAPAGMIVRYSLDGTSPGTGGAAYSEPIVLDQPGLWELRYALGDGAAEPQWVHGALYDVE